MLAPLLDGCWVDLDGLNENGKPLNLCCFDVFRITKHSECKLG
jgi:hypothetical protein